MSSLEGGEQREEGAKYPEQRDAPWTVQSWRRVCAHFQEQAYDSLVQLRDRVSPGHLFIWGHIGLGFKSPGVEAGHPARHPRAVFTSALLRGSMSPYSSSEEEGGSGGGSWRHWGGCHSLQLQPMGLPRLPMPRCPSESLDWSCPRVRGRKWCECQAGLPDCSGPICAL